MWPFSKRRDLAAELTEVQAVSDRLAVLLFEERWRTEQQRHRLCNLLEKMLVLQQIQNQELDAMLESVRRI